MTTIRRRRRYTAVAAGLAATVATAALATAGTAAARTYGGGRGELVSVTPLRDLSDKNAVTTELSADGFDTSSARDAWFRLGALAPISGAYDFRHAELPAVLDGELVRLNPDPQVGAKYAVIYGAYTLVALNRVHPFYASPAEVFRPAYAGTIQQLFDGDHTGEQLFNGTPATLDQLVNGRGLALLAHPTGGLAAALRGIDGVCAGWTPTAPTRLYTATRDEQAVNANTEHCEATFAAHRKVPVVDLGTPDYQGSRHLGSNVAATAQLVDWFGRLA
jgi:hypothetical protein